MLAVSASDVRRELARARERDQIHGAYLFHGPPGTGKRETAFWLARLLLDRPVAEGEAAEPFPHPDCHPIEPERAVIKIEQVRALQQKLSLVANEGGRRVGLVLGAEKMRDEAINALLKTLEEPPADATLVLVASSTAALPPTVLSRTTEYGFAEESEDDVFRALVEDGFEEDDARLAASLGGGSAAAARAWAEDVLDEARELHGALAAAGEGSASDVLDFAETFRGGGDRLRERARLFCDVQGVYARERILEAARAGDNERVRRWVDRAEDALRARRELVTRNLNPQLLVEGLLLDVRNT